MKRRIVLIATAALVSGCQSSVKVPTTQELVANKQLLDEWQQKCSTGEYSQLGAAEKAEMCSTTQNAVVSVAQAKSGQSDLNFFEANSKKK